VLPSHGLKESMVWVPSHGLKESRVWIASRGQGDCPISKRPVLKSPESGLPHVVLKSPGSGLPSEGQGDCPKAKGPSLVVHGATTRGQSRDLEELFVDLSMRWRFVE